MLSAPLTTCSASLTTHYSNQRGASLLEAAIALPIFLGLVFAALSAMQVLYSALVINEGLRQAGRVGATATADCTNLAVASFSRFLSRFDVDAGTFEDENGQPLPILSVTFPDSAGSPYGEGKLSRTIRLSTNVRIRCALCDTAARLGFVVPGKFERTYTVPLEDQTSQCAEVTP